MDGEGRSAPSGKGRTVGFVFALVVLGLALAGVAAGGQHEHQKVTAGSSESAPPSVHVVSAVGDLEQQLFVAINQMRREQHVRILRASPLLAGVARLHSRSMAAHGFFDHSSFDGSAFWQRIKPLYPPLSGRYWATGENIVWATPALSAQAAIRMWLKSALHRQNLFAPYWREVGIGGVHALGAPGVFRGLDVTIVTADFGVR